ncbi:MAG: type VI secretion system lipoprotein TssJ [Pseudomonadota bacterium]
MTELRFPKSAVAVAAALFLVGCGGAPEPALLEMTLAGEPGANAGPSGEARPLSVRILRLKDPGKFNTADFFSLQNPEGTLGADLLGSQEIVVAPGAPVEVPMTFEPEARFLGVIASYREIDAVQWRASAAVPPEETTPATVTLGPTGVSVSVGD